MPATNFTPIQLYRSTTASQVPTSGNLSDGELAINTNDEKLYFKNSGGTVKLLASSAGASGDVVGPASATDNAVVRFDGTTGKLVQNSVVTIADSTGDVAGVGALTMGGNLTLSGGTANGVLYLNGSKVATSGSALTFDGTNFATTGTASATKFIPTGGTATGNGMYLPTSNELAWSNNGSETMRLTSTGLGIGTSSPGAKLDVRGYGGGLALRLSRDPATDILDFYQGGGVSYIDASLAGTSLAFATGGTARMRIDSSGNLLLNGTSAGASAVGTLAIFNGTAPTGSVTDGIILYAQDVSSSSELKVRDEAGNVTTLSPHNFSLIPYGPSEDMAWAYYSEKGGKRINVDMLKLARMVEKLTGEKLVYES